MKHARKAASTFTAEQRESAKLRVLPAAAPGVRVPVLGTARIVAIEGSEIVLEIGGARAAAMVDAAVHSAVLAGAFARGERVLFEQGEGGALVVVGALRTQPTPGIDAADVYTIDAKRIELRAGEELSLTAQAAAVVLRAAGEVETYAERVISRAEGVHKIIGRILRLN